MHKARRVALTLLVLIGIAVPATIGILWQQGYRAYAVQTGSMAPTYRPGDVVLAEPPSRSYAAGDVITYQSGPDAGSLTTHRVVEAGELLTTKGDANEKADVGGIAPEQVRGRVIGSVSGGGYVLVYLKQPAGLASIVTITLSIMCLWSLFFSPPAAPAATSRRARAPRHAAPSTV